MTGIAREGAFTSGDRVVVAIDLHQRKPEVVVEFGLVRAKARGALEQRQCVARASPLIGDDAEKMQRK